MKTLVIVIHPNLRESKINRRLAEALEKQTNVTVHRLYEAYPNEAIDVAAEQKRLEQHDRIVLQFPFYWYSSPPLLKKWLDEVLTFGWAFGPEGNKLHGKELLIAISTGSPQEAYGAGGYNQYTISELLRPFQATSNLIGTLYLPPYVVYGARTLTDEALEQIAGNYAAHVTVPDLTVRRK